MMEREEIEHLIKVQLGRRKAWEFLMLSVQLGLIIILVLHTIMDFALWLRLR